VSNSKVAHKRYKSPDDIPSFNVERHPTITVGELVDALRDYPRSWPVMIAHPFDEGSPHFGATNTLDIVSLISNGRTVQMNTPEMIAKCRGER